MGLSSQPDGRGAYLNRGTRLLIMATKVKIIMGMGRVCRGT